MGLAAVQTKAVIGIYFAAATCPACATFTPQLIAAYDELMEAGKSFEVVLASTDGSTGAMLTHMRRYPMPWLALPAEGSVVPALIQRHGVGWIPTLVVIDGGGRTISTNGRVEISTKGAAAFDDWMAAAGGS